MKEPFAVPEFDAKFSNPVIRYFWWSWHPLYPYWSRYGSIGYETQEEAWTQRCKPSNSKFDVFHNKLVEEGDGAYTVVADDPCRKLDVWRAIKAKMVLTSADHERTESRLYPGSIVV